MAKRAFEKMMAGMEDAIAYASGDTTKGRIVSPDTIFPITRFLTGYYRVSAPEAYGNVKKMRYGEFRGMWVCDIRRQSSGELIQYAGVWKTKREGVEEVQFILQRYK
jgi:hypothetical protein